ncbi:hypothetical protein Hanom_Chr08g00704321 [Helianthus anomalus]
MIQQYSMIRRLETNKLRNVAKFFAHLLETNALPWHVLAYIRLTETPSLESSSIFSSSLHADFESIFPRDNLKNTRFSINLFTSIGLCGITEELRGYLKSMHSRIITSTKEDVVSLREVKCF